MVEVFLSFWLIVGPLTCLVLVDVARAISCTVRVLVYIFFDVVSLTGDWITQNLIRLLDLLEHFVRVVALSISEVVAREEVRVVLLSHLVIGVLYFLLRGVRLHREYCVEVLLFLAEMEEDGPSAEFCEHY